MNNVRLSHSSKATYQVCGHKYRLHYLERYRSTVLSSALVFGSAIDQALNHMLENKDADGVLQASIDIFNRNWEQGQDSARNAVDMPLNPLLKYSKYDYDNDLLGKADWRELFKYDSKFFETKTRVDKALYPDKDSQTGKKPAKAEWLDIPEEDRMVYNYANWICLQKKGELLLTAYYNQILPNIKNVLAVQKTIELDDGEGNILNGVIDAVVELNDGHVIILDNKTTSQEYEDDSVAGSEQLATYYAILNIFADTPGHEWVTPVNAAGYAVMSKKLIKEVTKVCKFCGHVANGAHKTCNNEIDGERCGGEWDKTVKFEVKTQFLVDNISDEYAAEVLANASVVKSCIEAGLFPKNFSACQDQYGSPCPFLAKCHGGSDKGLIKLEEKK